MQKCLQLNSNLKSENGHASVATQILHEKKGNCLKFTSRQAKKKMLFTFHVAVYAKQPNLYRTREMSVPSNTIVY